MLCASNVSWKRRESHRSSVWEAGDRVFGRVLLSQFEMSDKIIANMRALVRNKTMAAMLFGETQFLFNPMLVMGSIKTKGTLWSSASTGFLHLNLLSRGPNCHAYTIVFSKLYVSTSALDKNGLLYARLACRQHEGLLSSMWGSGSMHSLIDSHT